MLPERVRTSSELLQPSISHPSLSTHIFWHESSSADGGGRRREGDGGRTAEGEMERSVSSGVLEERRES